MPFLAAFEIDCEKILVADERYIAPTFRHLGICFEGFCIGQAADGFVRRCAQAIEIKITSQGKQDALAIWRPGIFNDSLTSDAHALPAGLLHIVELLFFGNECFGVNQHPVDPVGDVVLPQILLAQIILLAAKISHPRTVG